MGDLGAVDASGTFTPAYAAYTKLTVANHLKLQLGGQKLPSAKPMSFEDFMTALKENKVVNKAYARAIPSFEKKESQINASHNGNALFEREKLSWIERAYQLGLVDQNGILRSSG